MGDTERFENNLKMVQFIAHVQSPYLFLCLKAANHLAKQSKTKDLPSLLHSSSSSPPSIPFLIQRVGGATGQEAMGWKEMDAPHQATA